MTGRVALVTGAGRRLGAEIVRHLARTGFDVIVHVHTAAEAGEGVVRDIREAGGRARLVQCDLSVESEVLRIFESVPADQSVSLIVNSASYFRYDRPEAPDIDTLKRSIDIQVLAPAFIFKAALSRMDEGQRLTVINILDQKLENMNPDYYSYTIGKYALYGMTKMWQSMPNPDVRVFGILLGLTLPSGAQTEGNYQSSRLDNPLRRAPTASDLCELIEYLVRQKNVQGQNIALDAGASLVRRFRDVAFATE
jgi:NAD(P)-dependent dehydrogenase (short-subunit alcohol dehydrogenase family)